MPIDLSDWLITTISSTAVITTAGYVFKDTLAKFFANSVEHRFDKKIESVKSELRTSEAEIGQVRSFIAEQRRERDTINHAKRIDAAENALKLCNAFQKMSMAVEFIKIINVEEISKDKGDPKIPALFQPIERSLKIDECFEEIGKLDQTLLKLYLDDHTLKNYDAYTSIILRAVLFIKLFANAVGGSELMKEGLLRQKIEELVPTSNEGFEKWGEDYAYYWMQYFYDEVLKGLRATVNGVGRDQTDLKAATQVGVDAIRAQSEIARLRAEAKMPEIFLKTGKQPELPV
ncbi:hypothetical protein PsAD46_04041 [Pseudovibrio sp. Ad46]|uniref:hypothetical protein n=1 Tax=Pseudovibrio sp. Ad46 TaxID=989432 RepID=UPI0007AE9FC7|nr:hypothetical protein [Pseudovibrio sp. Ad46]KZK80052.1 hypothetical protein PsAD46_04041 [Pseudovibrio sp. Ad46]